MKRVIASAFVLMSSFLFASEQKATNLGKVNIADSSTVETVGFDCAKDVLPTLHLLGRGEEFPAFLARDIETELKRQQQSSKLKYIECNGEPVLEGSFLPQEEGQEQRMLANLSATFPVTIRVYTGRELMVLNVEHKYFVQNIHLPEQRKVLQTFKVLQ